MSWSGSISGHDSGATPDDQKAVEEGVKEVLLDAFGKLKALEGHEFTPPTIYFHSLGGYVNFAELLADGSTEGSDE